MLCEAVHRQPPYLSCALEPSTASRCGMHLITAVIGKMKNVEGQSFKMRRNTAAKMGMARSSGSESDKQQQQAMPGVVQVLVDVHRPRLVRRSLHRVLERDPLGAFRAAEGAQAADVDHRCTVHGCSFACQRRGGCRNGHHV